ncbi:hypothetical protein GCM10020000_57350 [Streptomyces olivoverticillatus]
MGDDQAGARGDVVHQGAAHLEFGDGVEAGGGVVEDEQPARVGEGAGQAEALELAAGQGRVGAGG